MPKGPGLSFDFALRPHPGAKRRADAAPLRILVLGDFAGRGTRPDARLGDLSSRRPLRVDIDEFDSVFTRLAPELELRLEADETLRIGFEDLDAFHPDSLFDRLGLFQEARSLRKRLADPSTFSEAAAELRASVGLPQPPVAPATEATPEAGAGDGDFSRLLGRPASAGTQREARAAGAIGNLIRSALEGHLVEAPDPSRDALIASLDEGVVSQMRSLLHHPDFQNLEAAWISLREMVTGIELGDEVTLHAFDLTWEELVADVAGGAEGSILKRCLVEAGAGLPGGEAWSLLVADFAFGETIESLGTLAGLGAVAAAAGGPVLASASPKLIGVPSLLGNTDTSSFTLADTELAAAWDALRKSAAAPWIGLTLPRVLARLPYGRGTEEIDRFAFEEIAAERPHEAYLWAGAGWAVARWMAGVFVESGWQLAGSDPILEGLPVHAYRDAAGDSAMQPCAEVYLPESAGTQLIAAGLIPILSMKNRDAASVMRLQSIADPSQGLAGPWSP